jgi:hypothetical protein
LASICFCDVFDHWGDFDGIKVAGAGFGIIVAVYFLSSA